MFDNLLNNLKRCNSIRERLLALNDSMSWEQIALALYSIIDDVNTEDDHCRENHEAFRKSVMQHQADRNAIQTNESVQIVGREIDDDYMNYMGDIDNLDDFGDDLNKEFGIAYDQLVSFLGKPTFASTPIGDFTWIGKMDDGSLFTIHANKKLGMYAVHAENKETYDEVIDYIELEISANEHKIHEGMADYARKELEIAGLFDKDSDYEGMIGEAVLGLIELFASQGHSGFSAGITREIFDRLASYKPLSDLTNDPTEWMEIAEETIDGSKFKIYQSARSPTCFSRDGGKTYYNLDEMEMRVPGKEPMHTSVNKGGE